MDPFKLAEFTLSEGATFADDVVNDVVVLGSVSRNGRTYSPDAMRQAVADKLFEGKSVHVDHLLGVKARRAEDRLGHLTDVRFVESENKIRGKLHLLAAHPLTPRLRESHAKGNPYYGLSPVMDGKGTKDADGKITVMAIDRVHSVDMVDGPATCHLVEQADATAADPAAEHQAGLDTMVLAICHGEGTPADKAKKIQTLLETMAPGEGKAAPAVSEQTLTPAAVGTLVEQAVAKAMTTALPTLVEQEVQRRAAAAVYVKPTTQPAAPVEVPKPAAKDEPPTEPEKRKKWLRSA